MGNTDLKFSSIIFFCGLTSLPSAGKNLPGLAFYSESLGVTGTLDPVTYALHLMEKLNPFPIYLPVGYAITVDPQNYEVEIVTSPNFETPLGLTQAISQAGGVAGINGGFYAESATGVQPEGLLKVGDKILGDSLDPQNVIGWRKNGDAIFGEVDAESYLHFTDGSGEIPLRQDDRIPEESILRVVVKHGHISGYILPHTVQSAGPDEEVLRVDPYWRGHISSFVGKAVDKRFRLRSFETDVSDEAWAKVDYIIRGNIVLVRNGNIADFKEWELAPTWGYDPMPRSGLCIKDNGFLQLLGASDATIADFAQFAKRVGCKSALNIDGGPSSTLIYLGKNYVTQIQVLGTIPIFNRRVHNHIVVVPRKPGHP